MQTIKITSTPWANEIYNKALERGRCNAALVLAEQRKLRATFERSVTFHPLMDPHKDNVGIYTVCFLKGSGVHGVGVAKRKPTDKDNPLVGEQIALMRAIENLHEEDE